METTTSPALSEIPPERWYRKRNVLIDVAVIAAVLAIIGFAWWWGHRPKEEPAPTVPQYSGQALVDEVQKKYGNHDYAGAIQLLKGQESIDEPGTLLLLAGAYANKGDYKKSLEVYQQVEKDHKLNTHDAATAGDIATQAGDYQAAAGFYEKAKQRLGNNDPTGGDQAQVYDAKISETREKL